jgi:hypothetical protein
MTPSPRRALLTAALGFATLQWRDEMPAPAQALHAYLDSWRGLGAVAYGMRAQGFAFNLSTVDRTMWRATFGRNPLFAQEGFGTGETPWVAVQRAAWAALNDPRTR